MSTELKPVSEGDFIVTHGWRFAVQGPVAKVTAQQVKTLGGWRGGGRETLVRRVEILFAGAEDTAIALCERLESSKALCNQETKASAERHQARLLKLIADAEAERVS